VGRLRSLPGPRRGVLHPLAGRLLRPALRPGRAGCRRLPWQRVPAGAPGRVPWPGRDLLDRRRPARAPGMAGPPPGAGLARPRRVLVHGHARRRRGGLRPGRQPGLPGRQRGVPAYPSGAVAARRGSRGDQLQAPVRPVRPGLADRPQGGHHRLARAPARRPGEHAARGPLRVQPGRRRGRGSRPFGLGVRRHRGAARHPASRADRTRVRPGPGRRPHALPASSCCSTRRCGAGATRASPM